MQTPLKRQTFLEFLPVSIFGGVMGMCGLCFSWRFAHKFWDVGYLTGEIIGGLAVCFFLVLTIVYLFKLLKYPALVKKEFENGISVSFFATFIVSLLLIPGILLPYFPFLATVIWSAASALMFGFAWYVLRKWLDSPQAAESAVPAWLMPVVGTLDVPVVGNKLPMEGAHEICLLFFGIGVMFTLILLPIIMARLFFQKPLTPAIQPTLMILTGPFSLAFTGYEGLSGNQDLLASVFFYFNFFLFVLFLSKITLLPKACPFQVSWWSVSFPLAAFTIAAFNYADHKPDVIHLSLAGILLFLTTAVITYLLFQTVARIITGNFVPQISPPQQALS
ncbi:SLAC1 anion channel family protein [Dyadobacter sp. CY345]|uniref:SLAC1 anion channel family protein n=1 Tax=Dyadobacter sp. CY345 TaxID=2909335 RepID=UPI001F304675|nr:SLAC1 anion channel family protein [Dyadobacter sp. CY345]MCF2446660.1 SLAC1 anion channel family protein [Dyadobacter sp. CY345]